MTDTSLARAPELERFDTGAALTAAAADLVTAQLLAGLDARGEAGLALSGGSTPAPL